MLLIHWNGGSNILVIIFCITGCSNDTIIPPSPFDDWTIQAGGLDDLASKKLALVIFDRSKFLDIMRIMGISL